MGPEQGPASLAAPLAAEASSFVSAIIVLCFLRLIFGGHTPLHCRPAEGRFIRHTQKIEKSPVGLLPVLEEGRPDGTLHTSWSVNRPTLIRTWPAPGPADRRGGVSIPQTSRRRCTQVTRTGGVPVAPGSFGWIHLVGFGEKTIFLMMYRLRLGPGGKRNGAMTPPPPRSLRAAAAALAAAEAVWARLVACIPSRTAVASARAKTADARMPPLAPPVPAAGRRSYPRASSFLVLSMRDVCMLLILRCM